MGSHRRFASTGAAMPGQTLKLGDVVPNFSSDTTQGNIDFHSWIQDSWAILFSHPADYTPVCTTELGRVQMLSNDFAKRGVKLIALSCDEMDSLQLTATRKVATPVDWKAGGSCMVVPGVKQEDTAGLFPKGVKVHEVPSGKVYLRTTPQPE